MQVRVTGSQTSPASQFWLVMHPADDWAGVQTPLTQASPSPQSPLVVQPPVALGELHPAGAMRAANANRERTVLT